MRALLAAVMLLAGPALADTLTAPPTPSATTTTQGKVKLAGDLGGTAALPTVTSINHISGGSFTGTLTGAFAGNGSGLTLLNAANVGSGTLAFAYGGTGITSGTLGTVIVGNGSALSALPGAASGKVLTSNGAGAAPSWQSAGGTATVPSAKVQYAPDHLVTTADQGKLLTGAVSTQVNFYFDQGSLAAGGYVWILQESYGLTDYVSARPQINGNGYLNSINSNTYEVRSGPHQAVAGAGPVTTTTAPLMVWTPDGTNYWTL